MRSIGATPQTANDYGAVFWINMSYGDADFAPLFLDANRNGSTQSLRLFTKDLTQQPLLLAQFADLGLGFINAKLDIDPVARTVELRTGSAVTTVMYTEIPLLGDDRWATVTAFSSAAEFDYVKVEVCP